MSWEFVMCWIEDHPGLASWGQFLGSMMAIGVAIWVAHIPERRHQKEEAKRVRVMKLAVFNIALGAMYSIMKLRDDVSEFGSCELVFPEASLMAAEAQMITMNSVDLTSFPNEEMLVPFIQIKSQMEKGLSIAKMIKQPIDSGVDSFYALTQLDASANNIHSSCKLLKKATSVI